MESRTGSNGTCQQHVMVFTGHMIDLGDRDVPRFPQSMEPIAKAHVMEAVRREMAGTDECTGIAGASSGGDILFHEVCQELGVTTEMFLAFPPDEFIEKSLAPAGDGWVERFVRLANRVALRVLPEGCGRSAWFDSSHDDWLWRRCNQWMLDAALSANAATPTLLALWDGETGDGPGRTAEMVEQARGLGIRVSVINTQEIFGFSRRVRRSDNAAGYGLDSAMLETQAAHASRTGC